MKGIKFGSYHSYDDWGLILTGQEIGSPAPKKKLIEIEGSDGVLDYTEYFGEVKFNNRSLSFTFMAFDKTQEEFVQLYSDIHNAIHGQKMKVILDDDPDFYYMGRVEVNEWKASKNLREIVIEVDAEPYKMKNEKTSQVVKLCGKNMLNLSTVTTMSSNATWIQTETGFDVVRTGTGGSYAYFAIPVKAGKIYAFSANGTTYHDSIALIVYTDRMYGTVVAYAGNGAPAIFTAKTNGIYLFSLITFSTTNSASFKNVMVEESASVGLYEPYSKEATTLEETLLNLKKTTFPKMYLQGNVTLKTGATRQAFETGTHILQNFPIKAGNNPITFEGNGIVLVEWQEGGL